MAGESHIALVMGDLSGDEPALVRVHTHALAEDVFGIGGSRELIEGSLRMIADAGRGGVRVPAQQYARVRDRSRVDAAPDRVSAGAEGKAAQRRSCRTDAPEVGLGGQILSDLGIHKIRLMTNTAMHVPALQGFGIEIVEQVPVGITVALAGATKTPKAMHYL